MRIRDGDSSDPGSGIEKSRIRDPGQTSWIRNTVASYASFHTGEICASSIPHVYFKFQYCTSQQKTEIEYL